jgi:O-antigen/teichoic acid export membrane protein
VAWSWLDTAGTQLIAIPTMMVMARLLSPAEFGVTAAAFFFINLAQRLTQFGFNSALVRHRNLKEEHLNAVFYVSLGSGMFMWLALTLAAPAAAGYFRSEPVQGVLRLASLGFLIGPLTTVPNALLARDLRIQQLAKVGWASNLTNSIVTIAFAWRGFSFWSIVFGYLASQVATSIGFFVLSRWRPTLHFSIVALRELLSFGLGIQAKRVVEYAALNLDNLVVGRVLGLGALGIYDKAFGTMSRLLSTVNTGGPGVSFRVFSLIQEQPERFRRAYRRVILTVSLIGCPVFTWLSCSPSANNGWRRHLHFASSAAPRCCALSICTRAPSWTRPAGSGPRSGGSASIRQGSWAASRS